MLNEDFYGLKSQPFLPLDDPRDIFESQSLRRAMAQLSHELALGNGVIELSGAPGIGKSSLAAYLLATVDPARLTARKIDHQCLRSHELVSCVCDAFGLEVDPQLSPLAVLEAFLHAEALSARQCLLVVDDCYGLSDPTLAELRMLGSIRRATRPLLHVLLLGRPAPTAVTLAPLGPSELQPYVEHRLALAGWTGKPEIDPALLAPIHAVSGGVPHEVNQILTRLLRQGGETQSPRIDFQSWMAVQGWVERDELALECGTASGKDVMGSNGAAIRALCGERLARLEQSVQNLSGAGIGPRSFATEGGVLAEIDARISALEAKLLEQERTVHHTLATLIELFEAKGAPQVAA